MTQVFEYERKLRWRPFGPGKIRALFGHFDVTLDIGNLTVGNPVYFHMYVNTEDDEISFYRVLLDAKTEDGAKAEAVQRIRAWARDFAKAAEELTT